MTRAALILGAMRTMLAALPILVALVLLGHLCLLFSNSELSGLIFVPTFSFVFSFLFVSLMLTLTVLGLPILTFYLLLRIVYASFNPLRILRAVREGSAPVLAVQPETDGALAPGETLHVERTR